MTEIIAHRGASKQARENTIAAFRLAQTLGAHWVELDVRRTQDGAMAIHHDPYLPDGRVICDTSAADLPAAVPNLAAALDACQGMGVNIEIKNEEGEPDFDGDETMAAAVVSLLAERGGRDKVLISSFHLPTIDRVRELNSDIPTAWLVELVSVGTLDQLVGHGHRVVHPWVKKLTQQVVVDCHARGIRVNTWTCDDPARMTELISWGIDGICTNVPDVAVKAIAAAGSGG
jgi:glycerophosphoryl diester phosphodiesterase